MEHYPSHLTHMNTSREVCVCTTNCSYHMYTIPHVYRSSLHQSRLNGNKLSLSVARTVCLHQMHDGRTRKSHQPEDHYRGRNSLSIPDRFSIGFYKTTHTTVHRGRNPIEHGKTASRLGYDMNRDVLTCSYLETSCAAIPYQTGL